MFKKLTNDDKKELLRLARAAIAGRFEKGAAPRPQFASDIFEMKTGVFVTLHLDTELRGCIGYVQGYKKLAEAVPDMALSAAFSDPRFPAVNADELKFLTIEISLLSPLQIIKNVDEIEVGKHGLIIEHGIHRGLLLPQVAGEWGWDREQFLAQTCRKAGLASDTWQSEDCIIKRFTAEIFSEKNFEESATS